MSGPNLVTVLFIFYHGEDQELKAEALNTLKELSPSILKTVSSQPEIHPEVLDLIARLHYHNMEVMEPLLTNRMVGLRTLLFVAEHASGHVLDLVARNDLAMRKAKELRLLIINNPHADKVLKIHLGWKEEVVKETAPPAAKEKGVAHPVEETHSGEEEDEFGEIDESGLSKYQQLLDMEVAEKIKMALTGDKEWRSLLIREANKLVCSAVLKNPRITEAEVLMVAKNRASNEELIRIILLNREWLKNYDMKRALVEHPRTPLQDAIRYMTFLGEKDIRDLAKSRNVSQAVINNARRMLMTKKR